VNYYFSRLITKSYIAVLIVSFKSVTTNQVTKIFHSCKQYDFTDMKSDVSELLLSQFSGIY